MHPSIALIAFIALSATPSGAAILYVNAAIGVNGGSCTSSATPCKTVTYAMAQAAAGGPGDEIRVAPGTHSMELGETFPIVVKSGVRLKAASGAASTILDASGSRSRVLELANSNADTLVEGFTITGGSPEDPGTPPFNFRPIGAGMTIDGGSPTIRGNLFVNNVARGGAYGGEGRGGAIHVANATPLIVNNAFRGNRALGQTAIGHPHFPESGMPGAGGAIYLEGTGGTISSNTFYRNAAIGSDGRFTDLSAFQVGGSASHGAVYSNGASVINNIFAGNWAEAGRAAFGTGAQASASFGALQALNPPTVSNNLFVSNVANGAPSTDDTIGTASVCTGTPCPGVHFHGEPSDLHIAPQSPGAGAGTAAGAPVTDLDGVARPSLPSIGAYEPSPATDPVRPVNIATRMKVLTGEDVMIGGFVIYGTLPKRVVVRARGPSLAQTGISSFLADPTLQLYAGQTVIASNDNWQQGGNFTEILASGFAPGHPAESAILVSLPPGGYTAIVSGAGGTTGVGLMEVFEVDNIITPLVNIATRGRVQTGDDVMIAGFIIQGTGAQTVVLRARGPSLSQAGITGFLADPVLELYSGQTQIAANDNWRQAANAAQILTSGFAPSDSNESALLVTLNPGAYTAIVRGAGGTTGVAIVEVFKN
jgi:hypothetical protein